MHALIDEGQFLMILAKNEEYSMYINDNEKGCLLVRVRFEKSYLHSKIDLEKIMK